ncbi:hypothetical protein [Adonisia turfae]|uniref:hypothetical protein n=1 Tax=Adonisia turfae TaxID=2950184 RepID=UPI0013D31872|nr:hypothetical protein [Adonisia turfae]
MRSQQRHRLRHHPSGIAGRGRGAAATGAQSGRTYDSAPTNSKPWGFSELSKLVSEHEEIPACVCGTGSWWSWSEGFAFAIATLKVATIDKDSLSICTQESTICSYKNI